MNTTVTQSGETFLTRSTQKIEAFFQILEIQETQRKRGILRKTQNPWRSSEYLLGKRPRIAHSSVMSLHCFVLKNLTQISQT